MGRDLHAFLDVKSNYTEWFDRMKEYGFSEGQDFIRNSESNGRGRPTVNHIISLDMAKEISMIQRTDKGKQALQNTVMTCLFMQSHNMVKLPQGGSGKRVDYHLDRIATQCPQKTPRVRV